MERNPGTQVIYETCEKIVRLLRVAEANDGSAAGTKEPYSSQELLDIMPALEAEAFEIGKACASMRVRLRKELGLPPVGTVTE